METNLRATFAGISVVLSFSDEEQQHSYGRNPDNLVGLHVGHLVTECNKIVFSLKVIVYLSCVFSTPLQPLLIACEAWFSAI